ncbi:unnamed protein product [Merluccius merluccius]
MMGSGIAGGNRKKSQTLRGVDPDTCMMVFKNHWTQVVKILDKHEPSRCGAGSGGRVLRLPPIPSDEASAVHNYVEHMLYLLMEEEPGRGGAMGPILEMVVVEGVMERLFLWSLRRHFTVDLKLEQLRMYQRLLGHARQPLLHHKPILKPLMVLLASCAGNTTDGGERVERVERELVSLLQQLCVSLVRDPSVLELFFHSTQDQGAANFLLFSLLIPFTHRQGTVGEQARSALLLIMSLSASEPRVTRHIVEHTYFCPVVATGLSGLYSALPAKLQVYSEDWHSLEEADWLQVPALVHFLHSLEFCSAVIKVAHPSIRGQLLGYINNGFLVPVLAPALHKLTVEEVMATTAYLDVFFRCVSEPALLHTFLSFILLHTHDHVLILDTLVSRVNTPFQLGAVSLALVRTLIGLFCEDVMLQLVLRYLISCECPLLVEKDCYTTSASCFLLLTPSCFPLCPPLSPHQTSLHPHSEHMIHWPRGAGQDTACLRHGRPCCSEGLAAPWVPPPPGVCEGDSVAYWRSSDHLIQHNYLHYLREARRAICTATRACQTWSAPYDGLRPSPQEERGEEEGRGGEEGRAEGGEEEDGGGGGVEVLNPEIRRPAAAPPFSADTVTVGNKVDCRRVSTLELEWDDMFREDNPSLMSSAVAEPPRHIQEMRRSTSVLLRGGGAYAEEVDFQDDVLVYHLVALRDARTPAMLEPDPSQLAESSHLAKTANSGQIANVTLAPAQVRKEVSGDSFLSAYRELMLWLGRDLDAEPNDDTDDLITFRRRVQALRKKQEEEGLEEVDFNSWKEEKEEEEKEEEEEEEERSRGSRKQNISFTGPLLSVLLSRLENLLENSISVNLLLTGTLAQLASYPQPLLRSFLLNTHTLSTRTLYQVLSSVRLQIENYVSLRPDYVSIVTQAWRFLLAKDQRAGGETLTKTYGSGGALPPCPPMEPQDQRRVFAIILFGEFLKELAALAQEHSITP